MEEVQSIDKFGVLWIMFWCHTWDFYPQSSFWHLFLYVFPFTTNDFIHSFAFKPTINSALTSVQSEKVRSKFHFPLCPSYLPSFLPPFLFVFFSFCFNFCLYTHFIHQFAEKLSFFTGLLYKHPVSIFVWIHLFTPPCIPQYLIGIAICLKTK